MSHNSFDFFVAAYKDIGVSVISLVLNVIYLNHKQKN